MDDLRTALVDAGVKPADPPPRQAPLRLPPKPSWERRPKDGPPPPSFFVKEWTMGDGRRIAIDKRSVAFVCEGNAGAEGKPATIVAFRAHAAKPVPLREPYADVVAWWLGDDR
jgi:hypothetical protein